MTIEINLGIGILAKDQIGPDDLKAVVSRIPSEFFLGSREDIRLKPYLSPVSQDSSYKGSISVDRLHRALEKVTGRQRRQRKVSKIGLLIADRFQPRPDFLGLMFDRAFNPTGFDPFATTPREGCAVFLGGIADHRSNKAEAMEELFFTSMHELGHVFNLLHTGEPSYMARSALRPNPFPREAFEFNERHKFLLSQCSESPYIWPGGSAFGNQGPFSNANNSSGNGQNSSGVGLSLRVDMEQKEFWPFEPVELDIIVKAASKAQKSVRIPDMVDPGYDEFSIFIEEPDGDRRRYQSPRNYCRRNVRIAISPRKPMRRDISIFGESGGFTFRKAGVHRIHAVFRPSRRTMLRSNVIEVNVLPISPENSFYQDALTCFTNRYLGLLMYHRRFHQGSHRHVRLLRDFCDTYSKHPSVGMARYAWGRALATQISEFDTDVADHRLRHEALKQLRDAIKSKGLNEHRSLIAEREIYSVERGND